MHSKSSLFFGSILMQLEATSMPNFSYRKVRSLPPTGLQLSAISRRLSLSMHRQAFAALKIDCTEAPTLYRFRRSQHLSRSAELLQLIACSFNNVVVSESCAFSEPAWRRCQIVIFSRDKNKFAAKSHPKADFFLKSVKLNI